LFYFDILTASIVYEDQTGLRCAGLTEACGVALEDASLLARSQALAAEVQDAWIDVCDNSRRTVAIISIGAMRPSRLSLRRQLDG